jgi:hypothetical protein
MEKITRNFKYCYDNDTTIEYVNTGLYSMLNCSFTSEDPDYGTDTIHYGAGSKSVRSMEKMAFDMLREVKDFLDYRDGQIEGSLVCDIDYDDYSNSTLIAIEYALYEIVKNYRPKKWYATIADASERIAKELLEDRTKSFSLCESDRLEASTDPEKHQDSGGWYGIKRIDGFFDNEKSEFIIAVGHYGGGGVAFGYADTLESDDSTCEYQVRRAILNATGFDSDNYIYIEEEEIK